MSEISSKNKPEKVGAAARQVLTFSLNE
jgi:hypothetical protein